MADLPTFDQMAQDASANDVGMSDVEQRMLSIEAAIKRLRQGGVAILASDPGTALPALVLLSAEAATAAGLSAFWREARSAAVVVLAGCRAERVQGSAAEAIAGFGAAQGSTNLETLRAMADPTRPQDYPPVHAQQPPPGAEAAIALAKLAGLLPALLVAEASSAEAGVSRHDVLEHATLSADNLTRVSEAVVPLEAMADCRVVAFRAPGTGQDHLAIVLGRPQDVPSPLVRVHSECLTGDLLGSLRCDCGAQLHGAIARIAAEGAGAVLYLAQEGRGIGLSNKLRAYTLQDRGLDTLDANRALGFAGDERDFQVAAAMLRQLGLLRVRLLTNNPAKLASLGQHGIEVTARVSLRFAANGVNDGYLATKDRRFGHMPGPVEDP